MSEMSSRVWHGHARPDGHLRILVPPAIDVGTLDISRESSRLAAIVPTRGSVTIYFANTPNLLVELQSALLAADLARLRVMAGALRKHAGGALHPAAGCTFDLLYRDRELASDIRLPDGMPIGSLAFSYLGGKTNDGDFRIVERASPAGLSYLVVRRAPQFSPLEQAMLAKVPPEHLLSLTIGRYNEATDAADDAMKQVADAAQKMVDDAKREAAQRGGPRPEINMLRDRARSLDNFCDTRLNGSVAALVKLRTTLLRPD